MAERFVFTKNDITEALAAGRQAAKFCEPDPLFWIDQAGLAGVELRLCKDTGLLMSCLDADFQKAAFLEAWLDATPWAKAAVMAVLRQRGVKSL